MGKEAVLIVGGSGFVGMRLARVLTDLKIAVWVVDVEEPAVMTFGSPFKFEKCSMLDKDGLKRVVCSIPELDAIIMVASVGMSGSGMLDPETEVTNVTGTRNVIDVCLECNIQALVYTSSYNVVFGGQKIANGTEEDLPYFPASEHTDYYSKSKYTAEEMVIAHNGVACINGQTRLRTMSLRPAAIYGPDEQRHFSRIIANLDAGLLCFTIGDEPVVDWIHIDNLCQAYVRAFEALHSSRRPEVRGKCYFVSDGTPVDSFEFLRPLCAARDAPFPSLTISLNTALSLAYCLEGVHLFMKAVFGARLTPAPFLTRAEAYKVGQTHYMSIDAIKRDLQYEPTITTEEGALQVARHYNMGAYPAASYFRVSGYFWWELIVGAMAALWCIAFLPNINDEEDTVCDPGLGPLVTGCCIILETTGLFIFRTRFMLQVVFYAAVAAHVLEALIALDICRRVGISHPGARVAWGFQTFMLGYPSLSMLQRYEKLLAEDSHK